MTSITFRRSHQNPEDTAGCYLAHFKIQERYHNLNVIAKFLCKMCNLMMVNYTAGTVYFHSVKSMVCTHPGSSNN